ncbi:hypothetical protein ACFWDI_28125 [Streptomyces sp. NPDC060064]|uniref:hypothetical protein n=1 Tax=Streptomyces sp. NPDC060064 TaxID=3347049 RepID=UPI0036C5BAF7
MNTRPARGKRDPRDIVDTTLRALTRSTLSVIDGRANALTPLIFGRLLPPQFSALIAERVMRRS